MDLSRLRNFGIVAHIDAGKTTVAERILFYTGVESRMGEVHEGTATLDWMDQERERGITISAAVTRCDWREHVLQLIDTPGHVDFTVEVERSLRVLDGAVVVLDAVEGVQAQTETVLRQARRYALPLVFFVNKIDRLGADFAAAVVSIEQRLGLRAVPIQLPVGEGPEFEAVLDLLEPRLLRWTDALGRDMEIEAVPEALQATWQEAHERLCAAVAETDEALIDRYLESGTLQGDELRAGLARATQRRDLAPVLLGAALRNRGIQPLLDAVLDFLPGPLTRAQVEGRGRDGAPQRREPRPDEPLAAMVFKVLHQAHGPLTIARIFSGTLRPGDRVEVARTGAAERILRVLRLHADEQLTLDEAGPGEMVGIVGCKHAGTGDTLCAKGQAIELAGMDFAEPVLRMTVEPLNPADSDKLLQALRALDREDPTLRFELDSESGQHLLAGMGELHLEVVKERLRREFRVEARFGAPEVSYREILVAPGEAELAVEVEGKPEGARAWLRVRLQPVPGSGAELCVASEGGDPKRVAAHCRAELELASGALGFPLGGLRAELDWGGDEPAMAAIQPAQWAAYFARALRQASAGHTALHEPSMELTVRVPEEFISGVLADLNQREAEIREVDALQGEIRAEVPLAEMVEYATELRSLSQGKGEFSLVPAGFVAPKGRRKAALAAKFQL